jgi:hypothetical protein
MRAIVSFLLLALVSCSGGSQGVQRNTEIDRGSMPEGGDWAGIWFTNWGEMSITKTGSSVVGSFCQEDRNRYGRFEGTANGDVMSFRWITNDVTMAGASRESEGSAIVQFTFVPAGENQSAHFEGTWGYNSSNADGGPLRGDRSPARSTRFLRGQYTLNCPLREQTEGAPPMSNEEVGDNPGDDGGSSPEEDTGSVLDDF